MTHKVPVVDYIPSHGAHSRPKPKPSNAGVAPSFPDQELDCGDQDQIALPFDTDQETIRKLFR